MKRKEAPGVAAQGTENREANYNLFSKYLNDAAPNLLYFTISKPENRITATWPAPYKWKPFKENPKCVACTGGSKAEVHHCNCPGCEFYKHRFIPHTRK